MTVSKLPPKLPPKLAPNLLNSSVSLGASPKPLQGLPPLVAANTRVLVLGSFPSVKSLQLQQYYAHPQNHFWRIMQALWPDAPWPQGPDYAQRSQCLLAQGVGLWDVYAQCEREGSLDSAIRQAQLNNFPALLARCPQLHTIAHNGGESHRHVKTLEKALANAGASQNVQLHRLPSSSPANATWTFEQKLAAWRAVIQASPAQNNAQPGVA